MRREVLVVLEGSRRGRMVERMERRHLRPWQQWWWRVVSHGVRGDGHVTVYITCEGRWCVVKG